MWIIDQLHACSVVGLVLQLIVDGLSLSQENDSSEVVRVKVVADGVEDGGCASGKVSVISSLQRESDSLEVVRDKGLVERSSMMYW